MKEKYTLAIIDNDAGVQAASLDAAAAKLSADKKDLKGFSGFFKKIWTHNLAAEYYRQQEISKAKKSLIDSGNMYVAEGGTQDDHDEAMSAVVERFVGDFDGVDKTAGEQKKILEASIPEERAFKDKIVGIVTDFASGKLTEQSFEEKKTRILSAASSGESPIVSKASMYADNLLAIARQIKQNIEHGQRIEDLDLDFEIVVGKAKSGVRTEAGYNKIDKLINKITSTKIGSMLNETTIAAGVGLAYAVTSGISKKVANSKAAALGTFGATAVLAGLISGSKEHKRLADERRQHGREMAQGKTHESDAKRRNEMEKFRHNTITATELINRLENVAAEADSESFNKEEFDAVVSALAEAEARREVSNLHNIDLVAFSSVLKVDKERTKLLIVQAKAKTKLQEALTKNPALLDKGTLTDHLKKVQDSQTQHLLEDDAGILSTNREFKKYSLRKSAQVGIKSLATGLVIGAAAQEAMAFFRDGQQGALEGIFHKDGNPSSSTAFEGMRRWLTGDRAPRLNGVSHDEFIGNSRFRLPEGSQLVSNPDGTATLMRDDEAIVSNLKFNDGLLTEESKAALAGADVITSEHIDTIVQPTPGSSSITETINSQHTVPATDYAREHPNMFHQIKRELWFDNNTKAFDKNELKLWWGGEHNTGIDAKGNYVFNIKHMMPKGSYHGHQLVNAQELIKTGHLKIAFSLSKGSQNFVFEVPVDSHGNSIIDPQSEAGQIMFANNGGHADFLGKYAEVVQDVGKDANGVEQIRVLSTHVGQGIDSVPVTTTIPGQTNIIPDGSSINHIPVTVFDVPAADVIDFPLVFPIMPRTPLERAFASKQTSNKTGPEDMGVGFGYSYVNSSGKRDENWEKLMSARRSKSLLENPAAELDPYDEAENYIEQWTPEHKQAISELARQAGPLESSTKLSICIPAAGHQEGKNIYKSLENYTKQTADSKTFEISVLVNRPATDKDGKVVNPDNTIEEIERFKKNYPKTKVKLMYTVLPYTEAKIGRARKLLNDAVIYRSYQRGKTSNDLILVSNDADNEGIAPEYVKNFIDKFENDPKADAMLGQLDWDPASYVKYPGIHIGTRLFQYLNAEGRLSTGRMPSSGANFAFRSSIYSGIGGYMEDLSGAEDVKLGEAMIRARDNHQAIKFAGVRTSRVYTSSRRAIDSWKSGLAPIEQWEKGFSAFDNEVRAYSLDNDATKIDFENKEQMLQLKKDFEQVITRTLNFYESEEKLGKNNQYYKRNINRLGIEYTVNEKDEIVITDMSRLIRGLKKYQKYGVTLRDVKSGKVKNRILKRIFSKIKN